jgi:oligosaccharide translocation protein RFT1
MFCHTPKGVAAIVELLSEPLYIISSTRLEFGRRARIDTAAMITKCLVTLVLVMRTSITPALVFAAAQLAFSGVVLLGYARYGLQLWRQVGCWAEPGWGVPSPPHRLTCRAVCVNSQRS